MAANTIYFLFSNIDDEMQLAQWVKSPFPRIASQPQQYILEKLHVYRDGHKLNNPFATLVKAEAVKLSEGAMRATSSACLASLA